MFKWLCDKLGNNPGPAVNKGGVKDTEVITERTERLSDLINLESALVFYSDRDPNNIVTLTIPGTTYPSQIDKPEVTYYFNVSKDGDVVQLFPQSFNDYNGVALLRAEPLNATSFFNNQLEPVYNKLLGKEIEASSIQFKILVHGVDIPKVSEAEATRVIKKQKPGTYSHLWDGNYLRVLNDDTLYMTDKGNNIVKVVTALQLDLVRYVTKRPAIDPTTIPKFVVHDYDLVDRKLIPGTDYRRWVVITELEGEDSNWVVRVVPKDIGRGCVRYFKMDFVFDQIDLGGVAFDSLKMIHEATIKIAEACRRDIMVHGQAYRVHTDSCFMIDDDDLNGFLNIDNINVIVNNNTLTYRGYLLQQNKHAAFKDSNPYLTPYSPYIRVGDQTIGFNKKGALVNFYSHECQGDRLPDDKQPYY